MVQIHEDLLGKETDCTIPSDFEKRVLNIEISLMGNWTLGKIMQETPWKGGLNIETNQR